MTLPVLPNVRRAALKFGVYERIRTLNSIKYCNRARAISSFYFYMWKRFVPEFIWSQYEKWNLFKFSLWYCSFSAAPEIGPMNIQLLTCWPADRSPPMTTPRMFIWSKLDQTNLFKIMRNQNFKETWLVYKFHASPAFLIISLQIKIFYTPSINQVFFSFKAKTSLIDPFVCSFLH